MLINKTNEKLNPTNLLIENPRLTRGISANKIDWLLIKRTTIISEIKREIINETQNETFLTCFCEKLFPLSSITLLAVIKLKQT